MTQFEFVMMVAAVVIALGLSQIVGGWGLLLRANEREIRFDWLHLGMSIMIAMGMLQYWVGMWAYEPIELEYGFQVALLVVPSFFLVIAACAISPDPELLGKNSCRHYYMSRRVAIFLPLAFASLLSVLADGAIAGFDELTPVVWLVFGGRKCANYCSRIDPKSLAPRGSIDPWHCSDLRVLLSRGTVRHQPTAD